MQNTVRTYLSCEAGGKEARVGDTLSAAGLALVLEGMLKQITRYEDDSRPSPSTPSGKLTRSFMRAGAWSSGKFSMCGAGDVEILANLRASWSQAVAAITVLTSPAKLGRDPATVGASAKDMHGGRRETKKQSRACSAKESRGPDFPVDGRNKVLERYIGRGAGGGTIALQSSF